MGDETKLDYEIKFNGGDPVLLINGMTLDTSEDSTRAHAFTLDEAIEFHRQFGEAIEVLRNERLGKEGPLSVKCPACLAVPGERCSMEGSPVYLAYHLQRRNLWRVS